MYRQLIFTVFQVIARAFPDMGGYAMVCRLLQPGWRYSILFERRHRRDVNCPKVQMLLLSL